MAYEGDKRFKVTDARGYAEYKSAASDYVANLTEHDRKGLRQKPLDWNRGHRTYLVNMQQVLNTLQALDLPVGATIVEVGAGGGWVTEILASLTYGVVAIEPSADMIDSARERVRSYLEHHDIAMLLANVSWLCSTMEEVQLQDSIADAVFYFESFHHVIDENIALKKTFAALKPGGQIAILGDSNWIPGNASQETMWAAETAEYGTLESPFTDAYLVWLLREHGFEAITRHHLVDGLVPVTRQSEPVENFASMHALYNNLVIARKPDGTKPAPEPVAPVEAAPAPPEAPRGVRAALARRLRSLANRIDRTDG
jgi:2-polyprenyl-3-methyl-5-hydroxy-6-metoxy-1,4-benzoquinol methylase